MRDEMRQFREASEHADFTSGDSETRFTLISSHSPGHDYIFSCPPKKHYLIFDFVTINEVIFLEIFIHYAEPDLKIQVLRHYNYGGCHYNPRLR